MILQSIMKYHLSCILQHHSQTGSVLVIISSNVFKKIDKMKRQRAMYQMKEQDKTSEKQLNEVEIGNLPE